MVGLLFGGYVIYFIAVLIVTAVVLFVAFPERTPCSKRGFHTFGREKLVAWNPDHESTCYALERECADCDKTESRNVSNVEAMHIEQKTRKAADRPYPAYTQPNTHDLPSGS